MTRQLPKTALKAVRGAMFASVVGVSVGLLLVAPTAAQQPALGSTNSVVIDLGVLDGGGGHLLPDVIAGQPALAVGDDFTPLPPAQKPISRLKGPLANRSIELTLPSEQPALSNTRNNTAAPAPVKASPLAPVKASTLAPVKASPPPPKHSAAPAPAVAAAQPTPLVPEPPAPAVTLPPAPTAPTTAPTEDTPPPPPTQTAAPAPTTPRDGDETRILFEAGLANLNDVAKAELDSLAKQMKSDTGIRLQLQAYAAGTNETAPDALSRALARRLSLSRALKVRSHLIEQGVRSTRMDVRALGVNAERGPADRVDAVIVRR